MNELLKNNKYAISVLEYLKSKYNEDFEIHKLIRRTEIVGGDIILGQCSSMKYPGEFFDVVYHLPIDDSFKREQIIKILNEKNVINENSYIKHKENLLAYLEDNYLNVIYQHQMDDSIKCPDNVKLITRINTPNIFPDSSDAAPLSEYLDNGKYNLSCYHYIFVSHTRDFDNSELFKALINNSIHNQYISIIYTDLEKSDCEKIYYDNYNFPDEAFEKSDEVHSIDNFTYTYGLLKQR